MGGYRVTPEELHQGSRNLISFADNIHNELDNTRREVERLGAGWEGASAQSFSELMAKWKVLSDQQQENLRDIAQVLSKAGDAYAQTEQSVGQAFRG